LKKDWENSNLPKFGRDLVARDLVARGSVTAARPSDCKKETTRKTKILET